jgi:hypothetical protein
MPTSATVASRSGMAGTQLGAVLEAISIAGVPDMMIQRILQRANVSTTATYYINTATDDVRNAMAKLERVVPETAKTPRHFELRATIGTVNFDSTAVSRTVN